MENKTIKLSYTIWYYITLVNGSLSIFNETLSKGEDSVSEALDKFNGIKEPKERSWSWEHALSMMIELVEEDEELNARRIAIKTIEKEDPLTVCYHAMSDNGLCEMFSTKEQAITRARKYMFENPEEYVYVTEQYGDEEEEIIWSIEDDNGNIMFIK